MSESDIATRTRGQNAARLLRDPLYLEAWDAVRLKLRQVMESAQTDEATLKAKSMLALLNDVQGHFSRVVTDGAIAAEAIRLEEEQDKPKVARWFGRGGVA